MAGKRKPESISKADWGAVDVPELDDERLRKMRPASEVLPDVVETYRRGRGKQKAPTKEQVTLRLDKEVVQHFRQQGSGWQTRINQALRSVVAKTGADSN